MSFRARDFSFSDKDFCVSIMHKRFTSANYGIFTMELKSTILPHANLASNPLSFLFIASLTMLLHRDGHKI